MSTEEPILTISVAASLLGLHPRTLMLYERAKLIKPHRTATNRRLFSANNLSELQFVKYLTHEEGVNLPGVKKIQEAIVFAEKDGVQLKKLLFPSYRPSSLL